MFNVSMWHSNNKQYSISKCHDLVNGLNRLKDRPALSQFIASH